jgi:hypothetical protein
MSRCKPIKTFNGRPGSRVAKYLTKNDPNDLPDSISILREARFVLGIEYEFLSRIYNDPVLELATAKHYSGLYMMVLT